jgi:SagB-type dehydrogenase family enzyme
VTAAVSPLVQQILDACTDWCTRDELDRSFGSSSGARTAATSAGILVDRLVGSTLLEEEGRKRHPGSVAMDALDRWNPAAGLFHTVTKNVRFLPAREADLLLKRQARVDPPPAAVKRYRRSPVVKLPLATVDDDGFVRVLRERRTWRRFSSEPVTAGELGLILNLTSGVQKWVRTGIGEVPLKTSPSGGARHPIECYVAIRRVRGIRAGLYHYAADTQHLERIKAGDMTGRIRAWMPQSGYFARAAFVVLFTSMFQRQVWRYPYARAYRAALVEAGHVCQTFCLTATWLGLAPFCLMGLADHEIERDLRIDGIRESVLYAAGAGRRPRGTAWAPLARGTLPIRPNRP